MEYQTEIKESVYEYKKYFFKTANFIKFLPNIYYIILDIPNYIRYFIPPVRIMH